MLDTSQDDRVSCTSRLTVEGQHMSEKKNPKRRASFSHPERYRLIRGWSASPMRTSPIHDFTPSFHPLDEVETKGAAGRRCDTAEWSGRRPWYENMPKDDGAMVIPLTGLKLSTTL